ncbi:MAG TPA: alpha-glucan family phosphorylase [Cyclobacteriaceae bacterium]|nr:alpha-glucan family phosphorylase [Cyclobacteriaceae bacterium]
MVDLSTLFPYTFDTKYAKPVAYFSMEFAIDQSLKIYSGGLGFLAGSHMRSAYELKQNFIGIGILWKYGYYDQERNMDGTMKVSFIEKNYSFLTETGIQFPITIHNHTVQVKVMLLRPEVFNTAPLFLLTTNIPENDHLARTISDRLYDPHESARIAQSSLLGYGGAKLLDILNRETQVYHLNEGHALPLCFYLWDKYKDLNEVKRRVRFTTHTPETAGNEEHQVSTLEVMSFFDGTNREQYNQLVEPDSKVLNYTLAALRMAKVANGVSQMHGDVSRDMWKGYQNICEIKAITNAQNHTYWKDAQLEQAFEQNSRPQVTARKKEMKRALFEVVANQTGKRFDENVLTIIWARRFAGYKRANLLMREFERFVRIASNAKYPVQFIWAGKPYPEDTASTQIFNDIYWKTRALKNCTILTGYELNLSALLKRGSDVWLNNPKLYREASGTSGMTAAMNGSINLSIPDGWVPEFAQHGKNCFAIEPADRALALEEQDRLEAERLYEMLEREVIPTYYQYPDAWYAIMRQGWKDVLTQFDSGRMADEYYNQIY